MESVKQMFRGIADKAFSAEDALKDVDRGDRAKELLENELLNEALASITEQIKEEMVTVPVNNMEALQRLRYLARATEMFQDYLQRLIANGKISKKLLSEYK